MNLEKTRKFNETIKLSDKEIFTKIWTSPRMVFKYLDDNKYDKYIYVLSMLGGITIAFDRAANKSLGDDIPLILVITICLIFGGTLGWITYYLCAALINWTGKWLNGQGDTNSLLRMISYALLPSIVTLVILIPQIVLFGNGIYQSEFDITSNGLFSTIIYYSSATVEIVLGIWTIVLFVIGISEIQRFSIGKSILNIVLPGLIIIIPIAMIAFIIRALSG
jgi:hypothetical protein